MRGIKQVLNIRFEKRYSNSWHDLKLQRLFKEEQRSIFSCVQSIPRYFIFLWFFWNHKYAIIYKQFPDCPAIIMVIFQRFLGRRSSRLDERWVSPGQRRVCCITRDRAVKYRNIEHVARLTHGYSHFVDTFRLRKSDINIGCKPRPAFKGRMACNRVHVRWLS